MRQTVNWGWLMCCLRSGGRGKRIVLSKASPPASPFQLKLFSQYCQDNWSDSLQLEKNEFFHVKFLNIFKIIFIKYSSRKSLVLFLLGALRIACDYGIFLWTYWLARFSLNVWHSTACFGPSFEAQELPQSSDTCDWNCGRDWEPNKVSIHWGRR